MKSEEKQDKGDFTYQGPSNRSLGGWSHDQLPKMVRKTNIVALHCSFLNLVKLCSEVLLWRYEVKEFEKCCDFFFVFFLFCIFSHENETKSHDFNSFRKLKGATIVVSWEK